MAYFDEDTEGNVKASRYKFCMSGKDLGVTLKAHMSAIGASYTVGRVRAVVAPRTLMEVFKTKDHENKAYFTKIVRVAHAFDHYFVYNIRRLGPFFPPPDMDRSAEAVIRYTCQMRGIGSQQLSEGTGIPEGRINTVLSRKPTAKVSFSLAVYEVSKLFEYLGISMYIMPNIAVSNKDSREVMPKKKRSE